MTRAGSRYLLIADDHCLFAEGVAELLSQSFDRIDIVHDGRSLVDRVEERVPDLVVLDISMPVLTGMEAARILRARHPMLRLLVLSMHSDPTYVAECIRAGANGYVLKQGSKQELLLAVSEVLANRVYITGLVARETIHAVLWPRSRGGLGTLTDRQRDVLRLAADGNNTKEIAAMLDISPRTVDFHKGKIMQSLGLHSMADLIRYAIREGLVTP